MDEGRRLAPGQAAGKAPLDDRLQILIARKHVYEAAKERNASRWRGATRNCSKPAEVWLNPERKEVKTDGKVNQAA